MNHQKDVEPENETCLPETTVPNRDCRKGDTPTCRGDPGTSDGVGEE